MSTMHSRQMTTAVQAAQHKRDANGRDAYVLVVGGMGRSFVVIDSLRALGMPLLLHTLAHIYLLQVI